MIEDAMRSYYDAYNSGDGDRLSALLDPDVVLLSSMGTQVGRDAYLSTYRYMIGQFVDQMEPQRIDVSPHAATVHIRDSLTAREDIPDFMGQPVTKGQTLVLDLIGRYTFSKGKIARIEIEAASVSPETGT